MKNTLEIDSVILEYGLKRILQNIHLKSETGKVTGILGRNGAGKTSLMKILFGEIIPDSRFIRINNKAIINSYRSPNELRYLPQNNFIPKTLSVKRIFNDFNLKFSDLIIEFPDFEKCYNIQIGNLSGGERRIIEIYSILVSETKFCMLDEPFSKVMPIHIETLKRLIVREKENKGIIITDHLYEHIIEISDDLYVISEGITYLTKSIEDLFTLGYTRSKS